MSWDRNLRHVRASMALLLGMATLTAGSTVLLSLIRRYVVFFLTILHMYSASCYSFNREPQGLIINLVADYQILGKKGSIVSSQLTHISVECQDSRI